MQRKASYQELMITVCHLEPSCQSIASDQIKISDHLLSVNKSWIWIPTITDKRLEVGYRLKISKDADTAMILSNLSHHYEWISVCGHKCALIFCIVVRSGRIELSICWIGSSQQWSNVSQLFVTSNSGTPKFANSIIEDCKGCYMLPWSRRILSGIAPRTP